MKLAEVAIGESVLIEHVGGERAFRRRLMELGLVPGTRVRIMGIAPLGDPIELLVRGSSLSIRRGEALAIRVEPLPRASLAKGQARVTEFDALDNRAIGVAGPT
jgi:ferrous iron transport protein A